MKCADCKFWGQSNIWADIEFRPCLYNGLEVQPACEPGEIWSLKDCGYPKTDSEGRQIEFTGMLTGPAFGCIHFEPRDEK